MSNAGCDLSVVKRSVSGCPASNVVSGCEPKKASERTLGPLGSTDTSYLSNGSRSGTRMAAVDLHSQTHVSQLALEAASTLHRAIVKHS